MPSKLSLFFVALLVVFSCDGQEVRSFRDFFSNGQNAIKGTIKFGSSLVSKGVSVGNKIVQNSASLVSNGIEKGTATGKLVVGAGTAIAGHVLAVGSNIALNNSEKVDATLGRIPILGTLVKYGNEKHRQNIVSLNKVGQTLLNGIDSVSNATAGLANTATQFGTAVVSNSAKLGAVVGQTTVALGTSFVQTGVDNVFTLGKNLVEQLSSGKFNLTGLKNNITTGSKWLTSANTESALASLLPALNLTLTSVSKKKNL